MLPTVTLAPPKVVTNRPSGPKLENNTCEPSFKPVPKIAAIDPGATGAGLVAKLALFTMAPSEITGPPGAGGEYLYKNRSEEHTSELQSLRHLVCRLLLE